jgi:multidrug resistance protein
MLSGRFLSNCRETPRPWFIPFQDLLDLTLFYCMEKPFGHYARSTLRAASAPNLAKTLAEDEEIYSKELASSSPTIAAAVGPAPFDDALELPSLPQTSGSNAQDPLVASKVPRHRRRGLFASVTILAEIEDPYQYPYRTKWFVVFLVAYAAAAAPLGSAIFFRMSLSERKTPALADRVIASLSQVAAELETTPTIVNLTVALYMLSMAIAPLWWSSLSEVFGRRSIYLISFVLFVVFAILCAVSRSIVMLTIMRILSGAAAASVQSVGAGTIADIWRPIERGKAMGIFYLGPLCGPLFAPVIGGALAQKWQWRATMWFLAIYGGMFPSSNILLEGSAASSSRKPTC